MVCSTNTLKKALVAQPQPRHERKSGGSIVDAVDPRFGTVARVSDDAGDGDTEQIGLDRSTRTLRDRVAQLHPVYLRQHLPRARFTRPGRWCGSTSSSPTLPCR